MKSRKIIRSQIRNIKYLYIEHIPAILIILVKHYGIEFTDELISTLKEELADEFFDSCEPEYATEEGMNWWESLNKDSFEIKGDNIRFKQKPPQKIFSFDHLE